MKDPGLMALPVTLEIIQAGAGCQIPYTQMFHL